MMNVALIGTGLMGRPMAETLFRVCPNLMIFNRSREKADPLRSLGIRVAGTPREAIEASDSIILMLTDASAIREVLFSEQCSPHIAGRTFVQMGTISPEESIEIHRDIVDSGGEYIEAPVLGSIPEAEKGSLIVMVGATPNQFNRFKDLLARFGPNPILIGPVGSAAAVKLAMNQLIASLTAAFSLSLGFVRHFAVEVNIFMDILRDSALYAPTFDKKLQRMLDRNYLNPNFPTKHLAKDIDLFLNSAKSAKLELACLEGVKKIIATALRKGLANTDYSAIYDAVDHREGAETESFASPAEK